ncbi:MAG: WS/DGAT domain-containing protein [Opitutaceae bacterium]
MQKLNIERFPENIFPLRLTPWEQLIYYADSLQNPMLILKRLDFSGKLNRIALDLALDHLNDRHPLMNATVKTASFGRKYWVKSTAPAPKVTWYEREPDQASFPAAQHIDLNKETGLRFEGSDSSGRTQLFITAHHSVTDGLGLFLFVKEFLCIYHALVCRNTYKLKLQPLSYKQLVVRDRLGGAITKRLAILRKQLIGLQGVRQYFDRKAICLKETNSDRKAKTAAFPKYITHTICQSEVADLSNKAKTIGVTVNDLLIHSLFLALADWLRLHRQRNDEDWIRMMIPINLRTYRDRYLPMTNKVSSIFLDRRPIEYEGSDALLKSIQEEMHLIKSNQLGYTLPLSLKLISLWPGALKAKATPSSCPISILLTNIGAPYQNVPLPKQNGRLVVGDSILEKIKLIAPTHQHAPVAVTAMKYANELNLGITYDSRQIDTPHAEQLLTLFAERVLQKKDV